MASVAKIKLMDGQALSGDTTGSALSLGPRSDNFIAFLNVSAIGAGTSLVVTVQHSPNNSTWFTLVAFTAATATGSESKDQAQFATAFQNVYPNVRAFADFTGGTTTATVDCHLYFDPGK